MGGFGVLWRSAFRVDGSRVRVRGVAVGSGFAGADSSVFLVWGDHRVSVTSARRSVLPTRFELPGTGVCRGIPEAGGPDRESRNPQQAE